MMVMVPVYIGQPTQMSQQGQLLCHAGLPVTAKKRISPDYCNRSIDVSIYLYYFWLFACTIVDAEPYQSNVLGSCYIPSCRSCPRQNQRSRHPWKTENYTLYPWHLSEMMMMTMTMMKTMMMMMSNKTSSQSVCLAQMEDDRVRSWHTLIVTASPSWLYDSCCICLFIIHLFVCYLFVYLLVTASPSWSKQGRLGTQVCLFFLLHELYQLPSVALKLLSAHHRLSDVKVNLDFCSLFIRSTLP